ncbi:MAG: hypothetical protein ACOC89_01095 [Candidatus Saliniplasma sp.]
MLRRFRGPKRASGTEQRKLVNNARELQKNPMKIVPECQGNCLLCKFGRVKRKVKKIEKYKEDEDTLKKYAKRGPGLSKALAGTLLLAIAGKAPRLGTTRTPRGEVSYAKRGSARKNRLVGLQHFDDPNLRLIAYTKEAKKGYYLYSLGDKVVCTGKKDAPPEKFIEESISNSSYGFKSENGIYYCSRSSKSRDKTYFKLIWDSADKKFIIDSVCAKKDSNLFIDLVSGMISKDNSNSFNIKAEYRMDCQSDCDNCSFGEYIAVKSELKEDYFNGKISDKKFIELFEKHSFDAVKNKGSVYAIGNRCYGKKLDEFLSDLRYEDYEEPAVKAVIKKTKGLVLENGTVNEFFSRLWDKNGLNAVYALVQDKEKAKELYDKHDLGDHKPREILKEAVKIRQEDEKLSSLPDFKKLPPKAKLADELARIYKVEGRESAVKWLEDIEIDDTRMRSLAYGFMKALGEGNSFRWKYSENEVESGEFMEEYIKALLEATGDDYTRALKDLLKISGSTDKIEVKD